jgi:hypothetical protein
MINLEKLKELILHAHRNDKLITSKHDPDKVSIISTPYRSVVSKQVADNLVEFINEGKYTAKEYQNTDHPLSPLYFTITPSSDSLYQIPSSGVTENHPSSALDTLIVVSGSTAGIHMYGNSSADIQNKISNGKLIDERPLT